MSSPRTVPAGFLGRRRRIVVVAAVALLAAIVSGMALFRSGGDDRPAARLTVGWGGGEGDPGCVYDPEHHVVEAKVTIDGKAPRHGRVTVTVTAYADENTSLPVGSSTRSVRVEGTVHLPLLMTIPVTKRPHVDVDGVAACALVVKD